MAKSRTEYYQCLAEKIFEYQNLLQIRITQKKVKPLVSPTTVKTTMPGGKDVGIGLSIPVESTQHPSTIMCEPENELDNDATLNLNGNAASKRSKGSILKCANCEYTTKHTGHFKVHQSEGCSSSSPSIDRNCPVCCKEFTYNRLRYHLRQYLVDSSKAINGHQHFTPKEHEKMLNKLTTQRKLEKEEQSKYVN